MKKRIFILSPSDRFNYGDLLFSHIIRYYFTGTGYEIIDISTSDSDLSQKGGNPTKHFKLLYDRSFLGNMYLIVAGGECLCAGWGVIYRFLSERFSKCYRKLFYIKPLFLAYFITNLLAKKIMGGRTIFPFSIGKNELPWIKGIYYNSVGGNAYSKFYFSNKKIKEIMQSIDYLAVRDLHSYQNLKRLGIKSYLVPDTAILMNKVFDKEGIKNKISSTCLQFSKSSYIFFQGKYKILLENKDLIINALEQLTKETGLNLFLCPIGTALGHEDDKGLQMIASGIKTKNNCKLYIDPNIYDIMWMIMHSQIYVGSSLHGVITAMSYNVPYCAYGSSKVKNYIDTWGIKELFIDNIKEMPFKVGKIMRIGNKSYKTSLDEQMTKAEKSILEIKQLITK